MRIHLHDEKKSVFLRALRRLGRPLVVAAALAGTLALGLGIFGSSARAQGNNNDQGSPVSQVGTWRVHVIPTDCSTGAPLPGQDFYALDTFARGGTFTTTNNGGLEANGKASPGHGFWSMTSNYVSKYVSDAFVYVNVPITQSLTIQAGTQKLIGTKTLIDENHTKGQWVTKFFDTSGNYYGFSLCGKSAGTRLNDSPSAP